MLRALHKSKIPIWHTEGFNSHPYATFPLPLSLGFTGLRECMDIRLIDEYDYEDIKNNLNKCLPQGIRILDVTEPVLKASEIVYASFKVKITCHSVKSDKLFNCINELFLNEEILIEKKTKKRGIKEIDIKPYIKDLKLSRNIGCVNIDVTLPAGGTANINPTLIQKAILRYYNLDVYFDVTKTNMFDKNMKTFK